MQFDIIVIGASSAGLHAAKLLSEAGKRVAVFDRQDPLSPARRTMIVTSKWDEVLGKRPEDVVLHSIDVMSVETLSSAVDVVLDPPDLIIERSAFILYLLIEAEKAGVFFFPGYEFRSAGGGVLRFATRDGIVEAEAPVVIGADGVDSSVARAFGIPRPPSVPILQAEIDLPSGWDPSVTKVWFDVEDTRYFYWLIPESSTRAVVGLVGDERGHLRSLLDSFLEHHGWKATGFQGAKVAMHHPKLRPWKEADGVAVLLVGDAAGQVKVTTVGGSVTGLAGAQAAARAVLNGTRYRDELKALKRELDIHWWIREFLERLDNSGYDALVRYMNPRVLELLRSRNRDEAVGLAWRLLLAQPKFLWLGFRAFTRRRQFPRLTPIGCTAG